MNTGVVVIDELPETLETVWLRILGKGKTQQKAIETLATLEDQEPLLDNVLDVFHKWHEDTQAQDDLTPEDKELLMILSPAYEKSRTQAILQERHFYVENLLKSRFGTDEALSPLIEPLVHMPHEESLQLLMQCSREELLAQVNQMRKVSPQMSLSPAIRQTQRVFVTSWLESRFGEIDNALSQVVESLVQLPPEESTRLLPKLSREELLARFGKKDSK